MNHEMMMMMMMMMMKKNTSDAESAIINRPFIVYCLFFVCYLLIYLFFNVISNFSVFIR